VSRVARQSKTLSWLFGCTAFATAVTALAQTAPPAGGHPFAAPQVSAQSSPPSVTGLGQVTLALLAVLAAVFAVAWLVRRMRGFGNRIGNAIDVLAEIPLGQKERAVLLKVGQAQILVGVTPGQVNTLHVLTEPIDLSKLPAGPADGRPSFKALMMRSLGK
jgi:flagellar protein FliO/FliZ